MIKGIVRKIDDLGRITLPREYRRTLGIVAGEESACPRNIDGHWV